MAGGVVRQESGNLLGSMMPLEGAQTTTGTEASCFRQGGKRPRTTSSIFAAAATGMLTGRIAPTAEAAVPSFSKQHARHHEQRPEGLFRLQGHMGLGRVSAPAASDSSTVGPNKRVIPGGTASTKAAVTAATAALYQSKAADAVILDGRGEEAAMAADEQRGSPPTPPPERSVGYHRNRDGRGQTSSSQPSLIDDTPERAWYKPVPFDSRTQKDGDDCLVEAAVVASSSLFVDGPSSALAPAYELSKLTENNTTAGVSWRNNPQRHLKETARGSPQDRRQQRHVSAAARAKGGDLEQAKGNSCTSRATNASSPQCRKVERKVRVGVAGDRHGHPQSPQQRAPAISQLEGERPPSPTVDRQDFLSTMKKSDDAYQNVREDLLHYMEGVRARTSEDGTPSVTFPKNFDRVVGLMGRNELEDLSPDDEAKDSNSSGGLKGSFQGSNKGSGKGRGKGAGQRDHLPPWTKYLLEEGLDRTKAFSRYRGVFADEQTGEDRVMRGMAKMRELDLRLAKSTERARELKIMARQAAEQAERTAAGAATAKRTSPRHNKGRGPVAVEDVATNQPRLRLPLPLSSEPAPLGAISSRVSNGSARQMDNDGGGGTGLRTERSEVSAASGGRPDANCAGGSSRDGQARGGRAFVTQNFRGVGREGSSSNTASASASVDGNKNLTSIPTPSGFGRWKNKLGGSGNGASRGGVTSGGGDRVCASSNGGGCDGSGGSSGVSFVLKNKRHAARARRNRLTDEQESLVSRFLQDADGFNDKGELTGEEPSGVWAEIAPYGGAGASDDAARLAEINAQILSIGGVVRPGRDEEQEEEKDYAAQGTEQKLPRPTATGSELTGGQDGDRKKTPSPPPPPPPSRSRATTGAAARDAANPGDTALREQRERREARCRETAIDNALEQLRDSLFQNSAAGGQNLREEAVDTALELVRSAPLDMQGGIRRGAGRIDSLLGGGGPQPVGEWEVKHALRQGEEELRGKDLASRENIKELLATVRQQSAVDSRCAGLPQRRDATVYSDDFPQGTPLDALFSLTDAVKSDAENISADIPSGKSDSPVSHSSPSSSAKREGSMNAAGTACEIPQQGDGNMFVSEAPLARGSRSAERARSSRQQVTEATETSTSTMAGAEGPSPTPRPRPRLPRKKQPSLVVPAELTALFRAPLLVPRHLDPPIAGIAAAAVAAGGASRVKSGIGVVSSDR